MKPMMLILILAALAILAFVAVYSFRSFRDGNQPTPLVTKEIQEQEDSSKMEEYSLEEAENATQEGTLMEEEGKVEVDIIPGL